MRTLLGLLLLLLVVGTQVGGADVSSAESTGETPAPPQDSTTALPDLNVPSAVITPWKLDAFFELPEVPEPSGLCWCELTGTMFVVDDGGPDRQSGLYELDLDGKVLRGIKLGKDLEGVCYCPTQERLYICDEADESVHVVIPQDLQLGGTFILSRYYEGKEFMQPGGNGFEGIAWCPDPLNRHPGFLAILNQDDPTCMLWLSLDHFEPLANSPVSAPYFMLPQRNSGELHFDSLTNEMWAVNSWLNTVAIVDMQSALPVGYDLPIKRWEVLPGMAQEGVAFDPQGRLWIGQDCGGIARYIRGE